MGKNDAKQIDFTRKHEEDLRRLRGLRLLDDDFMQKVSEDKTCTELLLQIILNRTDLKVIHINGQQDIKNLQGRSVSLDILAVDVDNKVYNIEIQRSDKGASVKRARYNSSLIDSNVTEPGEKYENLCESYIIFITENDIMKEGSGVPWMKTEVFHHHTGTLRAVPSARAGCISGRLRSGNFLTFRTHLPPAPALRCVFHDNKSRRESSREPAKYR